MTSTTFTAMRSPVAVVRHVIGEDGRDLPCWSGIFERDADGLAILSSDYPSIPAAALSDTALIAFVAGCHSSEVTEAADGDFEIVEVPDAGTAREAFAALLHDRDGVPTITNPRVAYAIATTAMPPLTGRRYAA